MHTLLSARMSFCMKTAEEHGCLMWCYYCEQKLNMFAVQKINVSLNQKQPRASRGLLRGWVFWLRGGVPPVWGGGSSCPRRVGAVFRFRVAKNNVLSFFLFKSNPTREVSYSWVYSMSV